MKTSSPNLTPNQRENWMWLLEAIREAKAAHDLKKLQAIMREFAIKVAMQQPDDKYIKVGTTTLIRFPNKQYKTKRDYLSHHARSGTWGEDVLLLAALEALGYQVTIKLSNTHLPRYVALEKRHSGLQADVVNYGAISGGTHWERVGESNPGAGDCMYYTLAQIIKQDLDRVSQLLPRAEQKPTIQATRMENPQASTSSTKIQTALAAPTKQPQQKVAVAKQVRPAISNNEAAAKKVTAQFAQLEQTGQQRYENAKRAFEIYSIAGLLKIYQHMLGNRKDQDSYLNGRPVYIAEELQEMGWQGNLENLLKGKIGPQAEIFTPIVHEALVHMLAKEVWRNASWNIASIQSQAFQATKEVANNNLHRSFSRPACTVR